MIPVLFWSSDTKQGDDGRDCRPFAANEIRNDDNPYCAQAAPSATSCASCFTSEGPATAQFGASPEQLEVLCQEGVRVGDVGTSVMSLIPPDWWVEFLEATLQEGCWRRLLVNEARPPPPDQRTPAFDLPKLCFVLSGSHDATRAQGCP